MWFFLDPPRTGLGKKIVDATVSLGAGTIVYVSCNPSTLARDLKQFAEQGYSIERVVPLDMFPHTYHIEIAVKLKKTIHEKQLKEPETIQILPE